MARFPSPEDAREGELSLREQSGPPVKVATDEKVFDRGLVDLGCRRHLRFGGCPVREPVRRPASGRRTSGVPMPARAV
jgi:hypothetical protein